MLFSTHVFYHVSVSPTNGIGPTQGQRKTLTRVGIKIELHSTLQQLILLKYKTSATLPTFAKT